MPLNYVQLLQLSPQGRQDPLCATETVATCGDLFLITQLVC